MRKGLFWFLAVLITLGSAVYQRMTGPTYPLRVQAGFGGTAESFKLPRSADTVADAEVAVPAPAPAEGWLEWKRFKTADDWATVPLARDGDRLVGLLPRQPAAGKLVYRLHLRPAPGSPEAVLEKPVVMRFKDPVPAWIIIPHILVMFAGMLLSTAAGLAALDKKRDPRRLVLWTVAPAFRGRLHSRPPGPEVRLRRRLDRLPLRLRSHGQQDAHRVLVLGGRLHRRPEGQGRQAFRHRGLARHARSSSSSLTAWPAPSSTIPGWNREERRGGRSEALVRRGSI